MTSGWVWALLVTSLVHPSLPCPSYNNAPSTGLHLYNNGHLVCKTSWNDLCAVDLLLRSLITLRRGNRLRGHFSSKASTAVMNFIVNARTAHAEAIGSGIHEYQVKRPNMLELNNFRMVNVIEPVSKSQKSHKSQRFEGFMFTVDVHSSVHC